MRLAALVLVIGLAAPAAAEAQPHEGVSFWEWVAEPNRAEVDVVTTKVELILGQLPDDAWRVSSWRSPADDEIRERADQILADAYGMLKYGLRLEPDHPELLSQMTRVATRLGRSDEAIRALRRQLDDTRRPEDRAEAELRLQLGQLHARRGELREAEAQYRLALAAHGRPGLESESEAAFALASLYMNGGKLGDAIELLESQTQSTGFGMWGQYAPMLRLALAVAYDRDGQISRAHDVLEKLSEDVIDQFLRNSGLEKLEAGHAAPLERHYFMAMIYETAGMLPEARSEWQNYAAGGPTTRHRGRARQHIRAIDALLRDGGTK